MWRTAVVLVVLFTASLTNAQNISQRVGQRVITKYGTPLRFGSQVVYVDTVFRVYKVDRVKGDWLWLVAGGVSGWVRSSEVVRFDQAIDFYTQEIAANPGNSAAWNLRGLIWNEKKDFDKAIADYNEAIRLDPT